MNETLTFLLIDENEDGHLIFSQAAKQAFPHVACFFVNSCDQAISFVERNSIPNPDLIFINWVAPDQPINGLQRFQLATELKGARIIGLTDKSPNTTLEP
ncbi:hypothetical protein [Dyadobacter crusticola]|uniref:hypothetical protein n=1 Tax=Dyadobacter crusticola TaxID=292407 RepID=UPI0004E2764E|nr:hypothetical protein [Dyadobacter crusticola]